MVLPNLGIDQSKKYFDACLLCGDKMTRRRFANTETGFCALSIWLVTHQISKVHLCVESTGRYANGIATYMHSEGHRVSFVNAKRIVAHRVAKGWKNKTDKQDSLVIADYLRANAEQLPVWEPPAQHILELRDIVGQITMLKKHRTSYSNRAGSGLVDEEILDMNRKYAGQAEADCNRLESRAISIVRSDKKLARIYEILVTVPGIGVVNALLLTALIDFGAFRTGRDLAVFLGLAAKVSESGTTEKRSKVSKEGNAELRASLKMGARSAKRGFYSKFAERLKRSGKGKNSVTNAVARKMILVAHACVRNDVLFQADYVHPLATA
jgi:transposase